jgi:hypothetical protein
MRHDLVARSTNVRRAIPAALAALCVLAFGGRGLVAGDEPPADKLPEPALQFAKETTRQRTDAEREWTKMVERLATCRTDFRLAEEAASDGVLHAEAGELLASAKKLLADRKEMSTNLHRFKATLKKEADNYREVAALYKSHAEKARSEEIREDYLQLAKAYERKATDVAERERKIGMPAGTEAKAEVIEEGNLFLERLQDALSVGSLGEAERRALAARLNKHGVRCQALAEELRQAVETLLQGSDSPETRRKSGAVKSDILNGAAWSAPVTVSGVKCVTIIRFEQSGNCSQSTYVMEPNGKERLVGGGRGAFRLDPDGTLTFYQAGLQVETGTVSFLGKDQWSYRIHENVLDPTLAGKLLTFTRER